MNVVRDYLNPTLAMNSPPLDTRPSPSNFLHTTSATTLKGATFELIQQTWNGMSSVEIVNFE